MRLSANETELLFAEPKLRRNNLYEGLEHAINNGGQASIPSPLTPEAAILLRAESARGRKRSIDEWQNVERTTFFRRYDNRSAKYCAASVLYRSGLRVPVADSLANVLSGDVKEASWRLDLTPLRWYDITNIGFNIMHGTVANSAVIPEHTDPITERGVVIAIDLTNYNPVMNLILCADS